jgi:glycosyltransferase involved in cell wall biosynthesis
MGNAKSAVIVINDYGSITGGASKVAIDSAVGLARRDHDVTYFCAVSPIDERLREAGIRIICLGQAASVDDPNLVRGALQNLWSAAAQKQLSQLLANADRKNTIVHVHSWTKALSPSCLWAIRRSNLSTIITVHDYFLACPNGGLFNYQVKQSCPLTPMSWSCLASNCDKRSYGMKVFRVFRQLLQHQVIGRPTAPWHFAVISDFCLEQIGVYLPSWARRSVVTNPLDLEKMPPADPTKSDRFIAVGRLSPEKGFTDFAEAARRAGVAAAIIGAGESRDDILAVNPSLSLPGWLNHSDVLNNLREARALIFPSLWPEPLGLSPLEAAAHGIPSVISSNTGARDWVVDGENGLQFPPGDITALYACLNRLKDDHMVSRLGRSAYDRYWANAPTLDEHVASLEELYETLLQRA